MKIDRSKLRKGSSQLPADCRAVIERLRGCDEEQLLSELRRFDTWSLGKCELYHWIDVLDKFDGVLEEAARRPDPALWPLTADSPQYAPKMELLLLSLHFTALLIEHSFSRHLYNSVEHLIQLLEASNMMIVLQVLDLIYMFSKRSNFITRLSADRRSALVMRLTHLAETWGGKQNGYGLADCCRDVPVTSLSPSATTLHFEYHAEESERDDGGSGGSSLQTIHMVNLHELEGQSSGELMQQLLANHRVPSDKQMMLFTYLRLAKLFGNFNSRLCCVWARLQALSILVYSNVSQDNMNSLLYPGLLEELVEVLEMLEDDERLIEIKAASLRTLTAVIHLDRNPSLPKLNTIIEITGANSFHGFLPQMVRSCITYLTAGVAHPLSSSVLTTALFSFLYHLASYETGGDALVHCGMMQSLLSVVSWSGTETDHVTFVTRAVRVIDLITNLDMNSFQNLSGLQKFISRLQSEVDICRKDRPYQIAVKMTTNEETGESGETAEVTSPPVDSMDVDVSAHSSEAMCLPQRSALLKSMLNFLKKAIQDSTFSDSIRHLMEGSLPDTLKHVISNAEYYGPSLFLLAIDVVTAYSFQEPSLLGSLQDNGLTSVVLHALLVKNVPATREVLSSLPNVFSALCLNARGLQQFVAASPFERLFGVLLSADYLPAMRRRRGSDPLSDTATKLGNAMDELMRHQPTLRTAAIRSIVNVLHRLCEMGRDPQLLCCRPAEKLSECVIAGGAGSGRTGAGSVSVAGSAVGAGVRALSQEGGSSDEEEEEEELPTSSDASAPADGGQGVSSSNGGGVEDGGAVVSGDGLDSSSGLLSAHQVEKQHVPLIDYVHNVMKFVDAILSNNSTDDHCREFVTCGGLTPLLSLLSLPNLPLDFPQTPACQAVASVCKAVVSLAHEGQVLSEALHRLSEVVTVLEPLQQPLPPPGGSVLLHELAGLAQPLSAPYQPQAAPLLHAMSAAHAYIATLIHISRTGQADIRQISVSQWGSSSGVAVLRLLSRLYTSIVWEGTVLLSLCTPNAIPVDSLFAKQDLDKLIESKPTDYVADVSEDMRVPADMLYQMKAMKPLLASASKLGRILTDLFALLVKLCVGSPMRQRRSHHLNNMSQIILPSSRNVARSICFLLTDAVSYEPPGDLPPSKLRLTVYTCTIGFVISLLFDEKKFPYHLMLQMFRQAGGIEAFFNMFRTVFAGDGSASLAEGVRKADLTAEGVCEFLDSWLGLLERLVSPRQLLDSPHSTTRLNADTTQLQPFNAHQFMAYIHKMAFQTVMILWHNHPLGGYTSRHAECILAVLRHVLRGEVLLKEAGPGSLQTASWPATAGAASVLFPPVVSRQQSMADAVPSGAPALTSSAVLSSETRSTPAVSRAAALSVAVPAPTSSASDGVQAESAGAAGAVASQAGPAASSEADPGLSESSLDDDHLQRLLDMGFPRQQCVVALHLCANNVQLATDYLLVSSSLPQEGSLLADGVGVLAGGSGSDPASAVTASVATTPVPASEMMDTAEQLVETRSVTATYTDYCEPLSSEQLDTFSESMLTGCLQLLDAIGETVYRTCDLIYACVQRNGGAWRDRMLKQLVSELCGLLEELISASNVATDAEDRVMLLTKLPWVSRTAVRIHLLSLLFEEMAWPCCAVVADSPLRVLCINLLRRTQMLLVQTRPNVEPLQSHKSLTSLPRWLAPLVLLIDMFEKFAVASQKRAEVAQVAGSQWRWYESYNHRWLEYPSSTNSIIDQAYWSGRASVDIQASGWKHIVTFGSMAQIHDDSNSVRPVMLSLRADATPSADSESTPAEPDAPDPLSSSEAAGGTSGAESSTVSSDVGSSLPAAEAMLQRCGYRPVPGLDQMQCEHVLDTCVNLLTCCIDADMLQAVLRLCLRLTRKHSLAVRFAQAGGIDKILALHQDAAFSGLITLVTFLVRHAIEDEPTLKYTMDKVIRTVTFSRNPSSREFHSVLRMMGPAICRDEQIFSKSAQEILRVDMIATSRRTNSDDSHLIVKPLSGSGACSAELTAVTNPCAAAVVNSLLQAMVDPSPHPITDKVEGQTPVASTSESAQQQLETAGTDGQTSSPLLGKSSLCRMLAELVRSYPFVARMVTEYSTSVVESAGAAQDIQCSALAYVLDHLSVEDFSACANSASSECVNACLLLVSALASCTHSPDAQGMLVSEMRAALLRALALPESFLKHYRVQTLACFIHAMIECCPSVQSPAQQSVSISNIGVNNIVKIMTRRGLVSDLARVSHSLDLSSPHLAATMNAVLKSLELLTRLSNSQWPPGSGQSRRAKTSSTGQEPVAEPATDATSNSEATNAQGESILEDPENTEHDVSGAEPTSEAHAMDAVDDNVEAALEEIMDQLLGRSSGVAAEESVLAESLVHEQSVPSGVAGPRAPAGADAAADEQNEATSEPETRDSDGDEEADGAEEEADGAGEEEPDEDEDDEEDEEEEDEEGSNYDEEPDRVDFEDLMYFIQGTGMRDVMDEYLMIRGFPDSPTAASLRPLFGERRGSPRFRPVPAAAVAAQAGATDSSTGNAATGAGVSGAGQVPPMHPLLTVRSNVEAGGSQRARATAAVGVAPAGTAGAAHRGYHYVVNTRHRRSAILQRLLGPHTHDVLQLAVRQGGTAAMAQREPPFLLGPEPTEFRVFTHDDEWHDDSLSGLISGAGANPANANGALGSLSLIPSAFARWTDESRVLDTLSMLDCVITCKPALWASLQRHRVREQAELTERRQQQQQAPADSNEAANAEVVVEATAEPAGAEPAAEEQMPVDLLASADLNAAPAESAEGSDASAARGTSSLLDALSRIREEGRQLVGDSQERIMDTLLSQFGATGIRGAVWQPSASSQQEDNAERSAPATNDAEETPVEEDAGEQPALDPVSAEAGAEAAAAGEDEPEATGPSAEDFSSILGDMEIPEGVDPSFLAALPEDMRQEVVTEQLRLQRIRQRYQQSQAAQQNSVQPSVEVSPEFLDALPPAIQEEVLAQQRQEQQRLAATSAAPDDPVDPGDFLQTLPAPLRQSILADLEDSQLDVLPPGLAAEAQALRRENEVTHRRHAHEPIDFSLQSRRNHRYAFHLSSNIPQRSQWRTWTSDVGSFGGAQSSGSHVMRMRGRQLLDQEAIACLLVLLFVDQPKLNTSRVHRVLRNLSYHCHTREWIMRSLLSMLERCDPCALTSLQSVPPSTPPSSRSAKRRLTVTATTSSESCQQFSWLNVSMDAALGCRANVFQLVPARGSGSGRRASQLHVHQQAAAVLCRHALDTLVALAKCFPGQLLPAGLATGRERRSTGSTVTPGGAGTSGGRLTDLWELLLRLDAQTQNTAPATTGPRVRALSRSHSQSSQTSGDLEGVEASVPGAAGGGLAASPFGQLMDMLQHPVVASSVPLTDQLLQLLSLLSVALRLALEAESTSVSALASFGQPEEVRPLISRVVHVLSSRTCSDEGMDDATKLLLNISAGRSPIRHIVMELLLEGARTLGESVCQRIDSLNSNLSVASSWYNELAATPVSGSPSSSSVDPTSLSALQSVQTSQRVEHGVVQNRYTNEQIVINPSRRVKCSGLGLQFSSMASLTSKHSSQRLFLRVLKVIIQIRNASTGRSADQSAAEARPAHQPAADTSTGAQAADQPATEASTEAQAAASSELSQLGRDAATTSSLTAVPAMDVDSPVGAASYSGQSLSQLLRLSPLWEALSCCLQQLEHSADQHAVLILQPAVEAFFLVHATGADQPVRRQPQSRSEQLAHISATADLAPLSPSPLANTEDEPSGDDAATATASSAEHRPLASLQSDSARESSSDDSKFVQFADRHRTVLNQILRQSGAHLADGPFSVLVNHTRVLDFDIKRRFFRTELERLDERLRREDLAVHVRRPHVFEDSYRELQRRAPEEWKNRFYIVFEGEEGQDAGGLLREWYIIIAREIFNPMYALFCTSPGDRVTYMIHHMSHCNSNHLSYFKFVGRVIAKAVYDNKLLDCYFSRSFYKHILGIPVKYTDMEAEDYDFYKGLVYLMEHDISELGYDLTFSTDIQEFGVNEVRDLKPNGRNVKVTEANKMEYVRLVCQLKMTGAIRKQLEAFLEGFYDIIPKHLISVFNEQELELLISGLPTIDLDDLKANTEYYKYQHHSIQIQWFWMALRSFSNEDRAKFIQFVTGTSRVPLQGFAELQGMNGAQKFQIHRDGRSTDRLPSAHTCFNQLDLPVYETYDKLRSHLLKAVQECSEGFGFI